MNVQDVDRTQTEQGAPPSGKICSVRIEDVACPARQMPDLELKATEWAEVRSKEEILRTLDKNGRLGGLPFMPEMFEFSGRRFRVYRRAHKTCDTVNGYKGLRMERAVHLEGSRCDGKAHGGCEAACLLFWKEAWLKKVPGPYQPVDPNVQSPNDEASGPTAECTEASVLAATQAAGSDLNDPTYVCQATHLPAATKPLPWWDVRQYFEDYASGNVGLGKMLRGFLYAGYYNLSNVGIGIGRPMRWLYDRIQALRRGNPYPRRRGVIPTGQRTPTTTLNLQPGELVRVKSYKEILETLDQNNKNRGLYFDAEVVPFCGGTYRVLKRVTKIIHEKTGKMINLKSCVILGNVFCQARYSANRMFCPRSLYQFMQEVWLERVQPDQQITAPKPDVTWGEAPAPACPANSTRDGNLQA